MEDHKINILLGILQGGVPVSASPFAQIAEYLSSSEEEVLKVISELNTSGIIRRLGGVFDTRCMGFLSTLAACSLPEKEIERAALFINRYPEVTHNYEREHNLNLWFTIVAPSQERINCILAEIAEYLHPHIIYDLPARKMYKIKVRFEFGKASPATSTQTPWTVSKNAKELVDVKTLLEQEETQNIIHILQNELPVIAEPYAEIAAKISLSEEKVLEIIQQLLETGALRRIAAILYHQAAGYRGNIMGAWQVPEKNIEDFVNCISPITALSHIYSRKTYEDWPYNIYTMVHGHDLEGCMNTIRDIARLHEEYPYQLLPSRREFKKTSVTYA